MKKLTSMALLMALMLFSAGNIFAAEGAPQPPTIAGNWGTHLKDGTLTVRWDTWKGGIENLGNKAELKFNGSVIKTETGQFPGTGDSIQTGIFTVQNVKGKDFSIQVVLSNKNGASKSTVVDFGKGGDHGDYKKENENTGKWPEKSIVSYIDIHPTDETTSFSAITKEQLSKYNVIIMGFTDAEGKVTKKKQVPKIKQICEWAPHAIKLITIGGEHTNKIEFTKTTAENLYDTVVENGLDGVDFDVEGNRQTADLVHLADLLREIFQKNHKDYFITAAPQLAMETLDGDVKRSILVTADSGLAKWDFTTGVYDAVMVQAYNSGENLTFPNPMQQGKPRINEANHDIVAAAYDSLQTDKVVSNKTKILIGIPVNAGAAPTKSNLWNHADNESGWDSVSASIINCVDAIYSNVHGIDGKQFGGLMAWSLNNDACDAFKPKPQEQGNDTANSPVFYFTNNVAAKLPVSH